AQRAGQFLASLASLPPVERPAEWDAAKVRGKALSEGKPEVAAALARLGARFGDPEFFPEWRALARDEKQPAVVRIEAVELLVAGRDSELGGLARELLSETAL